MLNVEICLNGDENVELESGTYNLNSYIGSSIFIGEYEYPLNHQNGDAYNNFYSEDTNCVDTKETENEIFNYYKSNSVTDHIFHHRRQKILDVVESDLFDDFNLPQRKLINSELEINDENINNSDLEEKAYKAKRKNTETYIEPNILQKDKNVENQIVKSLFDNNIKSHSKEGKVNRNDIIFNGYITIADKSDIKVFKYKTINQIIRKENYLEEYFPNRKQLDSYRSVIGNHEEKFRIFKSVERILELKIEIAEIFGINRCVLIYGEPGVGKSTFSKALVQKLSIRMNRNFILRTIHCSCLFSRFYGESMKILEEAVIESNENTIFLFDEADSILMDRKLILQKNEPGDSLRMVNLLLNILDRRENLFIFTSNFKKELDPAFLSRCDFSFEMVKLTVENIYNLLKMSIEKLFEIEFNTIIKLLDFSTIKVCREACRSSRELYELAFEYKDLSPREIKKKVILSSTRQMRSVDELIEKMKIQKV